MRQQSRETKNLNTEKRSWQTNINVLRDYSKNTLFSWRWDVSHPVATTEARSLPSFQRW